MATNLSIDPELIEQALELSGERTKKAAVTKALQEFIARRRQRACWSFSASSNGTQPGTTRLSASAREPLRGYQGLIAALRWDPPADRGERDRMVCGRNLILPGKNP